ncbi:MAG: hypothetical protein HY254_02545 [Burkholderiales bacterium]|nr:hypothetical protein [Burkholderiales bacterium]
MEIGTAKNYFYLLNISANISENVYVYLKYIYDILKNDMSYSLESSEEMSVGSGRAATLASSTGRKRCRL